MREVKNIKKDRYTIMCFSDIHGNAEALKALLEERKKLNIDETICLGDIISKGPDSNLCIDLIKKENITCLQGNNEYFVINGIGEHKKTKKEVEHLNWVKDSLSEENKKFIESLDNKYVLKFNNNKTMQFAHFLFGSDNTFVNLTYLYKNGFDSKIMENNDYDYVFFGHKHKPGIGCLSEKTKFFIVGSCGCLPNNMDTTQYLLIEYDKGSVHTKRVRIPYDNKAFEKRIKESDYPNKVHYMKSIFEIK